MFFFHIVDVVFLFSLFRIVPVIGGFRGLDPDPLLFEGWIRIQVISNWIRDPTINAVDRLQDDVLVSFVPELYTHTSVSVF